MKIIVGGAGSVGRSIISYLSRSNNDIVVVDTNQDRLSEIAREFDVQPLNGSIAHPDIQEKAGADKADILIAATNNDEVNLVACQVGYTLFNIPKKIARIDSEYYLSPMWNTLFNEKSLPIDLIISPDTEIAEAVLRIINLSGSREAWSLADNKLVLAAFRCASCCPLNGFTMTEIYDNFPQMTFSILQIVRENRNFYPKPDEKIQCGDEVYVLTKQKDADYLLHAFGAGEKPNENIVIFGGNAIAYDIARNLEDNDSILNCRIIASDSQNARMLADELNKSVVIQGEMMSDVILKDAGIDNADMTIAVTSNDKDNLLASLLAGHSHVCSTISLVNSRAYDNLIDNIGDNIIIDRSSVTISKILQDIRKANLLNACSLGRGFGEVWELKISEDGPLAGKKISSLSLPDRCRISAIVRGEELIFKTNAESINENDVLVIFVVPSAIKRMEQIFS